VDNSSLGANTRGGDGGGGGGGGGEGRSCVRGGTRDTEQGEGRVEESATACRVFRWRGVEEVPFRHEIEHQTCSENVKKRARGAGKSKREE
jgi:hypothetical protein